jgi:hypothetical protein
MGERTLCSVFPCMGDGCPMLIMLPDDAFQHKSPNRVVQSNVDGSVVLVCQQCKTVAIYSLQPESPYYDPRAVKKLCFRDGETEFSGRLLCAEETHGFQVPLFVTWKPDTTLEERTFDIRTWRGENLRCPHEHSIFLPKLPARLTPNRSIPSLHLLSRCPPS